MAVYKGGRGYRVPYDTKLMRVPIPLEEEIQKFIDSYRQSVSEDFTDLTVREDELKTLTLKQPISKEEAIKKACQIIRHKKGLKLSLGKLLTAIYQETIVLESD